MKKEKSKIDKFYDMLPSLNKFMFIIIIIALYLTAGCSSIQEVDSIEVKKDTIEVVQPKPKLPDQLILKKTIEPEIYIFEDKPLYCVSESSLKAQIHNNNEYIRYIEEMYFYLQTIKKLESVENKNKKESK